tara:strand:- start:633 stop:848 length:216 start_codon:yes stop_codon:yes gene_type:complete
MNKKNILSEGWLDKFFKKLKNRKNAKILKKDKNFINQLKRTNQSVKNLEKIYGDLYGTDLKLSRFTLKDFI